MPLSIRTILTGAQAYASVFLGKIDQTAQIPIDVTQLTSAEIDTLGNLKPGVPFMSNGRLVTSPQTKSTVPAAVAGGGNTGNGTVGTLSGGYGAPAEVVTILMLTATTFSVTGAKSGYLGAGSTGVAFTSPVINFTVTAGGTAFVAGDSFTFTIVTPGVTAAVFGVSIEPIKVAAGNDAGSIAAASTAFEIGLGTAGTVDKALAETNLGRSYTAAEVAGFAGRTIILLS